MRNRTGWVFIAALSLFLAACQTIDRPIAAAPASTAVQETPVPVIEPPPLSLPTVTLTPASLVATEAPPEPPTEVPSDEPSAPIQRFEIGDELTIAALAERAIEGSEITIEQQLENGANYARYIASYFSEGYKIHGLLTVPFGDAPEGGHKAIVFIHGYIPPNQYRTTERYVAYVDALARAGFVVFKIDLRGFGNSEGEPTGAYFSPAYSIDAISALKSLQALDYIDPEGIGLWGHSMAGNVTLRAMLVEPAIQAGVIWAGAVYSYDDFTRYSIDDPSYSPNTAATTASQRAGRLIRETYGMPNTAEPYWKAVSLTENIERLQAPLQLHHARNDDVVTIDYARDLAAVLNAAGKVYAFYEYDSGGHNIASPAFNEAMQRTIEFFRLHL